MSARPGPRKKPRSSRTRKRRKPSASSRGTLFAIAGILVVAAFVGTAVLIRLRGPLETGSPTPPISEAPVPAEGSRSEGRGIAAHPEKPSLPQESSEPGPRPSGAVERGADPRGVRSVGGIPERPKPPKGRIVFVIDDAGYNLTQLEPFLKFPGPLTISVLPRLPYSEEAARRIRAAGKEVILHQPMEALGEEDPGPGAVRTDMDELTIAAVISGNLASVPGAVGMNNHMGSAVTRNSDAVRAILETARAAGVYYLDSLTVSDSVVDSTARSLNMKTWERDVFLDNYPERAAILKQIDEGVKRAEKKGLSVMIGHVWSAELAQTLVDLYPSLIDQGFSLSTISRIMLEDTDEDTGD